MRCSFGTASSVRNTVKMARTDTAAVASLGVTRVGETVAILRPREALRDRAVTNLRDAFLDEVDGGALAVVVDLSEVDDIGANGAAALASMGDLLLSRNGALWIAVARPDVGGHTLREIETRGAEALGGICPALDAALERLVSSTR
jgi:anti-anti-sigma regulatory factor